MRLPISIVALIAGVPILLVGLKLLLVWLVPIGGDGSSWVRFAGMLGLLETMTVALSILLTMHRLGSMSLLKRYAGYGLFVALSATFAVLLSLTPEGRDVLSIFVFVMLGRCFVFVSATEQDHLMHLARDFIALTALGTLFILAGMAPVPEFGIDQNFVEHFGLATGTGSLQAEPHRVVAMMAIYYIALGLVELF